MKSVILLAVLILILFAGKYLNNSVNNQVDIGSSIDATHNFFSTDAIVPEYVKTVRAPCAEHTPEKNAYFGALHIHTAQSFDAFVFDGRNRPDDAYAYARGEAIKLPPFDSDGEGGRSVTIPRVLDFAAVTDHAENLGEIDLCLDSQSDAYGTFACELIRGEVELPVPELYKPLVKLASLAIYSSSRSESICGESGGSCIERSKTVWQETQQAAERWYDRSENCEFTTFVGYEYSLAEKASNLHRNVIFANGSVPPIPMSAKDAPQPRDLWQWLKKRCIDSASECDVLAIPHNSNWSNGRMFYPEYFGAETIPEQKKIAELRSLLEPLVEIMQVKGDSECRNDLFKVSGAADEFCDFEKLRIPEEDEEDCGDQYGSGGMMLKGCLSRWSYARYGLIEGLAQQKRLGVNPMKFGFIAASDSHNGTGGAVSENDFQGSIGQDYTPQKRLLSDVGFPGKIAKSSPVRYNPGGLAGIWAEENSRESLFAAMKRRETFGTSGPRIETRFFGGWHYPENICEDFDLVKEAYAGGVAMGSDLPVKPANDSAPMFVVNALRDPAENSGMLQRIQIIKGWMAADGTMHQKVHEVAGNGDNGTSVDINSCQRKGEGYAALCAVWKDPEFDPGTNAVYYARVLENPACRWSTYQCNQLPIEERPESCFDSTLPKTIQERAWTSPIWYSTDVTSNRSINEFN